MLSRGLTLTDPHLDSGITGVGIRQKKKKKVQQAIDEDATITEEIEIKMEKVMKDRRKRKIADYLGAWPRLWGFWGISGMSTVPTTHQNTPILYNSTRKNGWIEMNLFEKVLPRL